MSLQTGAPLQYHRVPITDEQAPREQDFDALVRQMRAAPSQHPSTLPSTAERAVPSACMQVRHMQAGHAADADTRYVFNCALGRGRTTTGLSIACLAWRAIAQVS